MLEILQIAKIFVTLQRLLTKGGHRCGRETPELSF